MNDTSLSLFMVGLTAQLLFSARMLVQWFLSEKAGRSLSPLLFWQLSIAGSILFFIYGMMRQDFVIVAGQLVVYFIYLRNLHLKQQWLSLPLLMRISLLLIPLAATLYLLSSAPGNLSDLLHNEKVTGGMMVLGLIGQLIFTLRFVIQWLQSERRGESTFTLLFWGSSLVGALLLLLYALMRRDPVLALGQATGLVVYSRNLILISRSAKDGSTVALHEQ